MHCWLERKVLDSSKMLSHFLRAWADSRKQIKVLREQRDSWDPTGALAPRRLNSRPAESEHPGVEINYSLYSNKVYETAYKKEKTLQKILQGPSISLTKDRRQRERRNRRKNLWGNVSLLRGWQQHHHRLFDVVILIMTKFRLLIHFFQKNLSFFVVAFLFCLW